MVWEKQLDWKRSLTSFDRADQKNSWTFGTLRIICVIPDKTGCWWCLSCCYCINSFFFTSFPFCNLRLWSIELVTWCLQKHCFLKNRVCFIGKGSKKSQIRVSLSWLLNVSVIVLKYQPFLQFRLCFSVNSFMFGPSSHRSRISWLLNATYFVDAKKGLCFAVVRNKVCQAVTKEMMQVRKRDCCCTAGKAWGTRCELCPSRGTGNEFFCLEICLFNRFISHLESSVESLNFCDFWVRG